MIFRETKLRGSYIIEVQKYGDERGFFGRSWCVREFEAKGIPAAMVQANIACSAKKGTLRGLHYQERPFSEGKLIRCTNGSAYDVIVDLRPSSATYRQWIGAELTHDNYHMLFVPEGFAHGYLTLEDNTEMYYMVSQFYTPEAERGIRYDDPFFGIRWPVDIKVISAKDKGWPDYTG
jgi:dTDP-4-dehydrorhamnose 3,5-epimerase